MHHHGSASTHGGTALLVPQVEARYAALEQTLGVAAMQEVYDTLDALLARAPRQT